MVDHTSTICWNGLRLWGYWDGHKCDLHVRRTWILGVKSTDYYGPNPPPKIQS